MAAKRCRARAAAVRFLRHDLAARRSVLPCLRWCLLEFGGKIKGSTSKRPPAVPRLYPCDAFGRTTASAVLGLGSPSWRPKNGLDLGPHLIKIQTGRCYRFLPPGFPTGLKA